MGLQIINVRFIAVKLLWVCLLECHNSAPVNESASGNQKKLEDH